MKNVSLALNLANLTALSDGARFRILARASAELTVRVLNSSNFDDEVELIITELNTMGHNFEDLTLGATLREITTHNNEVLAGLATRIIQRSRI
ncbi:MAG TPA: hypothetical protein VLB68_17605 [Pyrinomonadaceae bacterium]|nr:hypothetical protein [Pyrinomonadaceae bacterium]